MTMTFESSYLKKKDLFEAYLRLRWQDLRCRVEAISESRFGNQDILNSIEYSLLSGGKRFRPVLTLAVAEAHNKIMEEVLPWALAVEMIHTYSLIHDDLPCMDNDDFRRGLPTNHKKFSEATALLAGDGLLTEAFALVAESYPKNTASLVRILAQCSGLQGMLLGQCLDLAYEKQNLQSHSSLEKVHQLKTGKLIQAGVLGAAVILELAPSSLEEYGFHLGFCFQVADDLLDQDQKENQNFVSLLGEGPTRQLLQTHFEKAEAAIRNVPVPEFLRDLAHSNLIRTT